jgi:hypothetical protein
MCDTTTAPLALSPVCALTSACRALSCAVTAAVVFFEFSSSSTNGLPLRTAACKVQVDTESVREFALFTILAYYSCYDGHHTASYRVVCDLTQACKAIQHNLEQSVIIKKLQ